VPIFRCLILGENFPTLNDDGIRELIGFYATRYVESENRDDAEQDALNELRQDEWLQGLKGIRIPEDPEARVFFEEIVEVSSIGDVGSGFTFFPMDENSANKSESECKT